jgi:hypothetical protein
MHEPPRPGVRWHRIAGAIVLTFLILEGFSQMAILAWSGQRYRSLSPYVWSPYGLVRNNPKLTSPAFTINRNGFRDERDYTQPKPPKTLRVLMLGGSTLYSGLQASVVDVIPETQRVDSRSTMAQFLRDRLAADPEMAGVPVEVLNASVNYNTIVEVSTAYLAEYAYWNPDFVIVAGSANNFSRAMRAGAVQRRDYGIMSAHLWRSEFDRMNRNDLMSASDGVIRSLADRSAAVALGAKFSSKAIDAAVSRSSVWSRSLPAATPTQPAPAPTRGVALADWDEFDRYVNEYLGYASAMTAMARRHDQQMAFFWEHLLAHVGEAKPLTPDERRLFAANVHPGSRKDAEYTYHARDRVAEFCGANGIAFLDPIERLKVHPGSVFIDYLHYTADGNRFMADFIYDQLRDAFHRRADELRAGRGSAH